MEVKPKRSRSRSKRRAKSPVVVVEEKQLKSILKKPKRKKSRSRSRSREQLSREIRSVKRKLKGPKTQDTFQTVSTMGVVHGNGGTDWARKFKIPVHPLLTKNSMGAGNPTPLADRAKNYGMWKVDMLEVIVLPLVGSSMVSGSLMFLALTQDGSKANPTGPDDVLAQFHKEVAVGKAARWRVSSRQLQGPRNGWWDVNTNEEANSSFGPSLDVWLYGATSSLGTVGTGSDMVLPGFTGPLWSLQLKSKYSFTSWEEKPALATLHASEIEKEAVTIKSDEGVLKMEISNSLPAAHNFNQAVRMREENDEGVGQTIWQIADTGVQVLSSLTGPWAWLIRGGWWLVKALFKSGENDTNKHEYIIYASVEDAQRDHPCVNKANFTDVALNGGFIRASQINAPNLKGLTENIVHVPGPPPKAYVTHQYPVDGRNRIGYDLYRQEHLSYTGVSGKFWNDNTNRSEQAVRLLISGRTRVSFLSRHDVNPNSGIVVRTDKPSRGSFVMSSPHRYYGDAYIMEGIEETCLWDDILYSDHWNGTCCWFQTMRPGSGSTSNQTGEPSIMGDVMTLRSYETLLNPLQNPPWPWVHVSSMAVFSNGLESDDKLRKSLASCIHFETTLGSRVWSLKTVSVGGSKYGKPVLRNGVLIMTPTWCYHYRGIPWFDSGQASGSYYPVFYPYPTFSAGTLAGSKSGTMDYYHPSTSGWETLPTSATQWHSGEPFVVTVVGRNSAYPIDPNNTYTISPRGEENDSFEIIPDEDNFWEDPMLSDSEGCPSMTSEDLEKLADMLASRIRLSTHHE